MNTCLIPARGGSKRIILKNIALFQGVPIIQYPILNASLLFDKVVVSTDNKQIKQVVSQYGVEIFNRSTETATDEAMLADVILEYLKKEQPEILCCLLPCTPLLRYSRLKAALDIYKSVPNIDSLVPIVAYSQPYQRALVCEYGKVKMVDENFYNVRSQDLDSIYYDPGQFWIINPKSFKKYKKLYMPNSVPFLMSEFETQDIDTVEDWVMLDMKYRRQNERDYL